MNAPLAPIEVFYSYADVDELLCIELDKHLSQLRQNGLITTFHKRQITAGTNWAKTIDLHLNTASVILLFISADFLASDYCYGIEMQRAIERHEANEAHVIPILLRPCDRQNTPFRKLQALPSDGRPVTSWSDSDEAFADIAQGIRSALQDIQHLAVSAPLMLFPRVWNVPYSRNPVFTGREEILSRIQTQLQIGQATALSQPQAINGLGGIGKTQIAVEYSYRYCQDYQAVLWALADTRESLVSEYVAIAELLNLPEKDEQDQTRTVQAVKRWLTIHTDWLLILDNADDLALVYEFFPSRLGGHLLLTTRAQATGLRVNCIEVEIMPDDVGALFLLRRAKLIASNAQLTDAAVDDVVTAREINEAMGGLPLALDQAGAYIEETRCGLSGYLQAYQHRRMDLLKKRGSIASDYIESVATTWSISFEKVEQRCPAAGDLLRLCAFLAPDAIPEEIIAEGSAHLGILLQPIATDPLLLNEAISVLRAYSLIRRNVKEKTLSIHRLVQAVLQDGMKEADRLRWAECTVLAVNLVFPSAEYATWLQCERLLPQVFVITAYIKQYRLSRWEIGRLLHEAACYLRDRARFTEAEPLFQQALYIWEQILGQEHPDVATALNGLAILYSEQRKYTEAEPLLKRALHIQEQLLGQEHLLVAYPLSGLAILYREQGRYAEAELLFQRVLHIREQQLKQEHPLVASSLTELAILYREQGRYAEAKPLYWQALHIEEQVFGQEHPLMAYPLNGLALLYYEQGKYAEAEPLLKRSLYIREQQLGQEHLLVAYPLYGLAILYYEQGKYAEAAPLLKRALPIWEQILGKEHSNVTQSPNTLAESCSEQEKETEETALLKQALHIWERLLGQKHSLVSYLLKNLANLYFQQRRYTEAEPLYQRVLHIWERRVGQEHPLVIQPLNNLATLYQAQGRYTEARALYQRALHIRQQALRSQSSDTVEILYDFAQLEAEPKKHPEI